MPLERKETRSSRPKPSSFRFSQQALDRLKVLSMVLNMSQVEVLESLLAQEYESARKRYPEEMRKLERQSALDKNLKTKSREKR
jgi:hypothetical protein